ncbi:hypothetical protein [Phenylobacterium sp.]|uniref:hypothetical protein n=1 Tax=Phenylobacterium sp. TaxID=1871053 RepID=UPI0025E8D704|nr:hypothetical protein [Phenylobacterium sp.]MBX3483991.1 hypothetical protein [Phenylobacterium sp.]MCW5761399.1 hypothetical protein [Phenylobacterium sp.]
MKLKLAAMVATLLAWPQAAPAAGDLTAVRVGGDEIRVPVPDGYCPPEGRYANIAQVTDAMDSQSITYLALIDCEALAAGANLRRYLFLRAPKAMADQKLTRAELIERMGPIPETPLNLALGNPAWEQARAEAERAAGRKLKVGADMRPVARDANGYYVAGVIRLSAGAEARPTAVAVGATVVKGHVLAVTSYIAGSDVEALRETLDVAKASAKAIAEANP